MAKTFITVWNVDVPDYVYWAIYTYSLGPVVAAQHVISGHIVIILCGRFLDLLLQLLGKLENHWACSHRVLLWLFHCILCSQRPGSMHWVTLVVTFTGLHCYDHKHSCIDIYVSVMISDPSASLGKRVGSGQDSISGLPESLYA